MRKQYTVEGDINAKKAKDAYPKLVLCDECVGRFVVINEEGRTYEPCVKCGVDD
ncbi:hypothetical protein [Vibrio ichthyoenteri]|uniref:hypothetical protein n=1 Tax=Vibrio ichthyoenteri TaxID=142461 RepID=UPI00031539CD|nr:hypothetical protein [Vibrio ichthyoenteri]